MMTHRADCELLTLPEEHTLGELKESFRHLALELHPDLGGDRDRFEAIREAYNRLLPEAKLKAEKCSDCSGLGSTTTPSASFTPMKQVCPTCGGTGKSLRRSGVVEL